MIICGNKQHLIYQDHKKHVALKMENSAVGVKKVAHIWVFEYE